MFLRNFQDRCQCEERIFQERSHKTTSSQTHNEPWGNDYSKRSSNIRLGLCEERIFLERSHKITSWLIGTTHAQGLIDLSYHKNSKCSSNIRLGLCEERIFQERSHKTTSSQTHNEPWGNDYSKRSSSIRLGLCEERIFLERWHKITS